MEENSEPIVSLEEATARVTNELISKYHSLRSLSLHDLHNDIERTVKEVVEQVIADLQTENSALRLWKDSAMKVFNDINEQEIGKALGLTLGQSVAPAILPGIVQLKAKVEHLVTALRKIETHRPLQVSCGSEDCWTCGSWVVAHEALEVFDNFPKPPEKIAIVRKP